MRLAAVLTGTLLASAAAVAAPYERELRIDDELDLYDLQAQGEISEDTLETLLALLQTGVDLNRASRDTLYQLPGITYAQVDAILQYRQVAGPIRDPLDLVSAGVISADLFEQIAPFLVIRPLGPEVPLSGTGRLLAPYTWQDAVPPPSLLQLGAAGPYSLSGGLSLVTQRLQVTDLRADPVGQGLTGRSAGYQPVVPKAWLSWRANQTQVVVGSFVAGFGQRLTLDNTRRATPDGIYPDDVVRWVNNLSTACRLSQGDELDELPCTELERGSYVLPDFTWQESFRGVAASVEDIPVGASTLSMHGFGSYQSRSAYQYTLYDPSLCSDPRNDDPACDAPPIYERQPDPAAPRPRFSYRTLRNVYDEAAGGGHLRLAPSSTFSFGVTGYGAVPRFNVPGAQLDFQEWADLPAGGPFGAVGMDFKLALGALNFFLEGTRSFDSMQTAGGGYGALQRTVLSFERQELELSFRYYGRTFLNPYARPYAAPDKFEGQRARNEAGARLRYVGKPTREWALRGDADLWMWPEDGEARDTAGRTNLDLYGRVDYLGSDLLNLALFVDLRNRDLAFSQRGECYLSTAGQDENDEGEPLPCRGEQYRVGGRATWVQWAPGLTLSAQYQHTWLDDPRYDQTFRQDLVTWLQATVKPADGWRIRARSRYRNQALDRANYLEDSLWSWVEVWHRFSKGWNARLRADVVAYLDRRESTLARRPSPEQRLLLELEAGF